jgi:nucleoside-diphosphate-sugar epimerase
MVTGAAGFIGSHICRRLLESGHEVVGVDCLTSFYEPRQKEANLAPLFDWNGFELVRHDLNDPTLDLDYLVSSTTGIFHQAGQPGVRPSWNTGFAAYTSQNILATQRILEAVRSNPDVHLVYASSSSVYGNADVWPCTESSVPRPFSPYGVTKLAAEHLVSLYAENYGLHTTSLRYFTVYGPGQRPDMAMNRFIKAALTGDQVTLYGTGAQIRDFTYVSDIVEANVRAEALDYAGGVINVSGGSQTSVRDVLGIIEQLTGREINLRRLDAPPGDVMQTGGSNTRAAHLLGWQPEVGVREGLERQVAWHLAGDHKLVASVLQ